MWLFHRVLQINTELWVRCSTTSSRIRLAYDILRILTHTVLFFWKILMSNGEILKKQSDWNCREEWNSLNQIDNGSYRTPSTIDLQRSALSSLIGNALRKLQITENHVVVIWRRYHLIIIVSIHHNHYIYNIYIYTHCIYILGFHCSGRVTQLSYVVFSNCVDFGSK